MEDITSSCAFCYKDKICKTPDGHCMPDCPTCIHREFAADALEVYQLPENSEFFLNSLRQVSDSFEVDEQGVPHPRKSRVDEIVSFCRRMGYHRVGLAFCTALNSQARKFAQILKDNSFDVVSVVCKVGGIEKGEAGLEDAGRVVSGRREITCNPLEQARILNDAHTELNIMLGLCVGHDSIFLKASEAYCTVLAVKDRMYAHNPIKALE